MGSEIKKPIFINSIDTMERIFNWKLIDFCDIDFAVKIVEVIFFDEVYFILVFFFFFFR